MTNAEKYKEVFGIEVDKSMCPTLKCDCCPLDCEKNGPGCTDEYWNKEYKGVNNG